MKQESRTPIRHRRGSRSIPFGGSIAILGALACGSFSWVQIRSEYEDGLADLTRRAQVLAIRALPHVQESLKLDTSSMEETLGSELDGHRRLMGMAVYRADGTLAAAGLNMESAPVELPALVQSAAASSAELVKLCRAGDTATHVLIEPASNGHALAVLHDAGYLLERRSRSQLRAGVWSAGIGIFIFLLSTGLAWAMFERPLHMLAEWMRRLRFGGIAELPPRSLPVRRLAEESVHLAATIRASRSRERSEAKDIVRSDRAWTRERLHAHVVDALSGRSLVVVSNREPYMHQLRDGVPVVMRPASGLVTGLDPVLRACGGLWVAHGSGDADTRTVDTSDCVSVPPDDPRYTLRRIWISRKEEQGYYFGFSNEGLWPLCHLTHERPVFRASDWEDYQSANRRFVDAVLDEIGTAKVCVLVQDYQLALVPGMLKQARPDLKVGLFWHIPWPTAEVFRICPYRAEILKGMLGADLVGFHIQQHCNNFLETVDRMIEAKLDWDRFAIELKGHTALVRPFPISVQSWSERGVPSGEALAARIAAARRQHGLENVRIGVGVDRIDYTKGIAERLRAIARYFEMNPEQIGKFTFVQLGAPSRTHIPRYRDLATDLEALADEINWKYQTGTWKPILFLADHHDGDTVFTFLRMASVCIVSSLHDGMNLVAKEYVAAKAEPSSAECADNLGEGVLILSEFAGAARDLPEALIINPYDTEEFAEAIRTALTMDEREQRQRMMRMRLRVEENNIYRWAAEFLTSLAQSAGKDGRSAGEQASRT